MLRDLLVLHLHHLRHAADLHGIDAAQAEHHPLHGRDGLEPGAELAIGLFERRDAVFVDGGDQLPVEIGAQGDGQPLPLRQAFPQRTVVREIPVRHFVNQVHGRRMVARHLLVERHRVLPEREIADERNDGRRRKRPDQDPPDPAVRPALQVGAQTRHRHVEEFGRRGADPLVVGQLRQFGRQFGGPGESPKHDGNDVLVARDGVDDLTAHPVAGIPAAVEAVRRQHDDEILAPLDHAEQLFVEFSRIKILQIEKDAVARRAQLLDQRQRRLVAARLPAVAYEYVVFHIVCIDPAGDVCTAARPAFANAILAMVLSYV